MKSKLVKNKRLIMVLALFSSIALFALSSYTASAVVYPPQQEPVADAGPDQEVEVGDVVTFDGSGSYDPDGEIVSWAWDFGDGNVGEEKITTHTYDTVGEYIVTLTVMDNDGLTNTDEAIISVSEVITPQSEDSEDDGNFLSLPLVAFIITVGLGAGLILTLTKRE